MALGQKAPAERAVALVMGGWDIVRPLSEMGLPCAVFAPPHDPVRWSRLVMAKVPYKDPLREPESAVAALNDFARRQAVKPVLFFPDDPSLLLASRYRERLQEKFHLPLADAALVEDLFDKGRFARIAAKLDLPVPPSQVLSAGTFQPRDLELQFPLVLKPVHRGGRWTPPDPPAKAVFVRGPDELAGLWRELERLGVEVLAQEAVPGPETRIESFHAYVRQDGKVAGMFTGRKLRTWPRHYGESSAVEITAARDVDELGRQIVARLRLRGPVKIDFKRAPDDQLLLLEVNPRFNLWHLPGAYAGVNLPALAYADAVSEPVESAAPVRVGVRWVDCRFDVLAARADGVTTLEWLRWLRGVETVSNFAWNDPMPFVRGYAGPALRWRFDRAARAIAKRLPLLQRRPK